MKNPFHGIKALNKMFNILKKQFPAAHQDDIKDIISGLIMVMIEKNEIKDMDEIESLFLIILKAAKRDLLDLKKFNQKFIRIDNVISDDNFLEILPELIMENYEFKITCVIDIKKLFHKLSDEQKYILQLRYFENLSFKEIAKILNISQNAAKLRHKAALKSCREIFV